MAAMRVVKARQYPLDPAPSDVPGECVPQMVTHQ